MQKAKDSDLGLPTCLDENTSEGYSIPSWEKEGWGKETSGLTKPNLGLRTVPTLRYPW